MGAAVQRFALTTAEFRPGRAIFVQGVVMQPLVIVDAANVVGSVPNGWWRDRLGATRRLRDALAGLATQGLAEPPDLATPLDVVLVVEGQASPLAEEVGPPTPAVVAAPGSGDDAVVDLVRSSAPDRRVVVVSADRGLRERVQALGAEVVGPRALPHLHR
jgi:hypothetical protein